MSRIGKQPIKIPSGVKVSLKDDLINVTGPKGNLSLKKTSSIQVAIGTEEVVISRGNEDRQARQMHGLYRTMINNMLIGVSQGFVKELEIQGVGYRADMKGSTLQLALGFSHPVDFELPKGITASVDAKKTRITLSGADKQILGIVAAKIKSFRPPEPYKGKGVRYAGEIVKRKEGKAASK